MESLGHIVQCLEQEHITSDVAGVILIVPADDQLRAAPPRDHGGRSQAVLACPPAIPKVGSLRANSLDFVWSECHGCPFLLI